jgi:hypothetical protein
MSMPAARAIAFYLPQFHPVPANDRWWGAGFTEWTNVVQAEAQFDGHYQPHLPADLGFYDLRLAEARLEQAELARTHGLEGFCYWHYWFKGTRLLERPFDAVLRSGEPNFPFCLAWANESWSRRWLGEDQAVLLRQEYSLADDLVHARWLAAAFSDERYIRIQGRPVFLVYRPRDLPSPQRTTDTIRREATARGLPEPYLLGITSFSRADYRSIGFDGTVEFAPSFGALSGVDAAGLKRYDYADACRAMGQPRLDYPTYPCALVGWDNTPRRGPEAIVLTDATPKCFAEHVRERIARLAARPQEERILFVNAWNEWAEGNHLEPDQRNGRGHLEAPAGALGVPVGGAEFVGERAS